MKILLHKTILLLSALVLCCSVVSAESISSVFDAREDTTRVIEVPIIGSATLYEQNNPLWTRIVYEYHNSPTARAFGDGGCGPTAASIVLGTLLDDTALEQFNLLTSDGLPYSICPHAINRWDCSSCKDRLLLDTGAQIRRFLPLVLGSYACGNNRTGSVSRRAGYSVGGSGGTGMQFLTELCPELGLSCTMYNAEKDKSWLDLMGPGTMAVVLSNTSDSPFSARGHYVVLAALDDDYFYILDPIVKASYNKKMLEVLTPGFVRVQRTSGNYTRLCLDKAYVISLQN